MGKYDYTGKRVYMGIDVHKKTYAIVTLCQGDIVKKDTMAAKPEQLISYIQNHFTGGIIKTTYEAGFSGFDLHRRLLNAGIDNVVVHPGSIEVASRDRVKTDKRDAKKLATQLAAGRLQGVPIPSLEQEAKRSASRVRENVVKMRQQVRQALLFTQGLLSAEDDSVLSECWLREKLEELSTLNLPPTFNYSMGRYAKLWFYLTQELKAMKQE